MDRQNERPWGKTRGAGATATPSDWPLCRQPSLESAHDRSRARFKTAGHVREDPAPPPGKIGRVNAKNGVGVGALRVEFMGHTRLKHGNCPGQFVPKSWSSRGDILNDRLKTRRYPEIHADSTRKLRM